MNEQSLHIVTLSEQPLTGKTETGKGKDYLYRRLVRHFTAPNTLSAAETYTIGITFADLAHGFTILSLNGCPAETLAGYTSCATGKTRTCAAVVALPEASETLDLAVIGLENIQTVTVSAGRDESVIARAKAERPQPEDIHPAFELDRPMQLVITVGDASPSCSRDDLPATLERMADCVPYVRSMGFNGAESYVRWDFVEYEKDKFDWSYYDAVIAAAARYGMKWFPLVIGGSAYALPAWYREETPGFEGFACLEHGKSNNIPTIFTDQQTPFVKKYLHELGKHYNDNPNVFGVRLGPSGNYGESQYPATGNWGYKHQPEHMHIGWWAGDKNAPVRFAAWLKDRYQTAEALSQAWGEPIAAFEEVKTFIPYTTESRRKRKDFVDWYMFEMTDWCNRWAVWTREELKKPDVYQSAGGWGFCECGTDFTDQTRGMVPVNGCIRATNEDESYELNFAITRMLSSAARFYGVPFGSEPAGYGTARSIINRLYNIIVNNGVHLFYYHGNFVACDESEPFWLKYAPLLNERAEPQIDVAVMYPDTESKLTDSAIRYLDGSSFFSQVFSLRRKLDYDFCAEQMVLDGALEKNNYKALVFLGRSHDGNYIESAVLDRIDAWVRNGGTVIYPVLHSNAPRELMTVEGDTTVYRRWAAGDTGKGKVILINTQREPLDDYIDDLAEVLKAIEGMSPLTLQMLTAEKPRGVYMSALKTGKLACYNDRMTPSPLTLSDGRTVTLDPVSIRIL